MTTPPNAGVAQVNRYCQVGDDAAARASTRRMAGMRNVASVSTAFHRSSAVASGRVAL